MTLRSNLIALIACCLIALALASCGSEGPPTAGEAKDFTTVCDKANDGKRVSLEGYLRFPGSFKGDLSVILRMYKSNDFRDKPVGVQIRLGNQANQLEKVPKQFTDKDMKVHLANGQVVGYGTKVRVSGTVYFPLVDQEFACGLSNPLVEPAN